MIVCERGQEENRGLPVLRVLGGDEYVHPPFWFQIQKTVNKPYVKIAFFHGQLLKNNGINFLETRFVRKEILW